MPFNDATIVDDDFAPAPTMSDEAAPEEPDTPDASDSRPLPHAVRVRARSSGVRGAAPNESSQEEARKARDESRAALEASRYKRAGQASRTSPFAGTDRGGTRGGAVSKGERMTRPKSKRRIGVIRLGVIIAACAVAGTYAGLYLQQVFNDSLPKSSVYEQTTKAPPPTSSYTF